MDNKARCGWVPLHKPTDLKYHDEEWVAWDLANRDSMTRRAMCLWVVLYPWLVTGSASQILTNMEA
jgi:hypothetical protein